jgi:energy-coupling factor transporter ATP-binding protein EcfA2
MAGLEVAVISLGAVVVKSACKLWLGDRQVAVDVSSQFIDMFAGRVSGQFEQRKLGRLFDECSDVVARRLSGLLAAEFSRVPENERVAAVMAVSDTFAAAGFSDEALFRADLDARMVERQLRPAALPALARALLSEGGEQVYWLVLRESCSYLVEVVTTLPRFSAGALTEVLRRETAILETLSRVLDRLPERRGVDDFTTDYRRAVANRLDRLELLGVTLADANRRYPLSIAYIDLSVMRQDSTTGRLMTKAGTENDPFMGPGGQRAAGVLGRSSRVLVVGHAGSGKTTLLQWLAVRGALGDFSGPLEGWAGTVPFYVPLRQYAGRALPAPEELPLAVGRNLTHEMPPGWVHGLLRAGRALVLVDGVDELPEGQRDQVRAWLGGLVSDFGGSRYVITSRPTAIREGWLTGLEFTEAELQPMSAADVREFIRQWHKSMAAEIIDADDVRDLEGYERSLIEAIDADRHLRALTSSPLLCALLCALNRERRTHLPRDRMEIYEAALDMLLDRRDRERGVETGQVQLTKTDKVFLLQDIAFWLVCNGWSDASSDRVIGQVARSMRQLHKVSAEAPEVYRSLLERSGILREPDAGRVDFVHRTFQEYLAAKAAVDNDEVGLLVANADDDQWREVIVMAAGHAPPDQCAELLRGLLKRRGWVAAHTRRGARGNRGSPIIVACLQTARRLDPDLRAEIEKLAEHLVPPSTRDAADALAGGGELVLDLLRVKPPRNHAQVAASIRAASRIGGDLALRLIGDLVASHVTPASTPADEEVIAAWRLFEAGAYVREVLARGWPPEKELPVLDGEALTALPLFPELRSVQIQLQNEPGNSVPALELLTGNRELRRVRLSGCASDLDLSPVASLPELEFLELECHDLPPALTSLVSVHREWTLTISAPGCGERLAAVSELGSLAWLHLHECHDMRDLTGLPARPAALRGLSLYGFGSLTSLRGIERWNGLAGVELYDCGHLGDLRALAAVTSLEQVALGLTVQSPIDLSPLADLPRLERVILRGHAEFDVTTLAGIENTVIEVPLRSRVIGVEYIGPTSRLTRSRQAWREHELRPSLYHRSDSSWGEVLPAAAGKTRSDRAASPRDPHSGRPCRARRLRGGKHHHSVHRHWRCDPRSDMGTGRNRVRHAGDKGVGMAQRVLRPDAPAGDPRSRGHQAPAGEHSGPGHSRHRAHPIDSRPAGRVWLADPEVGA